MFDQTNDAERAAWPMVIQRDVRHGLLESRSC